MAICCSKDLHFDFILKLYFVLKVVELHDVTPLRKRKIVEYRYHLLHVKSDSTDVSSSANINLDTVADQSSMFLRAGHLVQIDSFLSTHGPCGSLFGRLSHVAARCIKLQLTSYFRLQPAGTFPQPYPPSNR